MCGIVMLAGDMSVGKGAYFDKLLYLDALRGWDSTGVFTVEPKAGEVNMLKLAKPAHEFIRDKQYDRFKSVQDVLWVGHNRAKTIGAVSKENAHPFEFENLIGVHNGTLQSWHKLDDSKKFTVDSECLYYNISKNGLKPTLEKTKGAFALVYYDKREHELVFVRNDERPLFYGFTEDKKNIVILSDVEMHKIAHRYTKGVHFRFTKNNKFTACTPNTIYRIALPDSSKVELTEDNLKREKFEPPVVETSYYQYGGWAEQWQMESQNYQGNRKRNKVEKGARESGKVLDFRGKASGSDQEKLEDAAKRLASRIHNNDYVDFVCRSVVWEHEDGHQAWADEVARRARSCEERLARMQSYTDDFKRFTGHQLETITNTRQELAYYRDMEGCLDGSFWELWHDVVAEGLKEEASEKKPSVPSVGQTTTAALQGSPPDPNTPVPFERATVLPKLPEDFTTEDLVDFCGNTPCSSCKCTDDEPDPFGTIVTESGIHVCKECTSIPFIWQMIINGEFNEIFE